jgi:hypothetical protein
MPWCETCAKFLTPTSMSTAGDCPTCGRHVADPGPSSSGTDPASLTPTVVDPRTVDVRALAGEEDAKAPWHFKLLIAALVIYLGWRIIQMITWVL